jgi:hypothetical protein
MQCLQAHELGSAQRTWMVVMPRRIMVDGLICAALLCRRHVRVLWMTDKVTRLLDAAGAGE